jgi:hypothetical protein
MNAITQLTPRELRQAADLQEKIVALQKKLGDLLGTPASPLAPKRKKRTISPAGIARIRAAQKARWAKVRSAKK